MHRPCKSLFLMLLCCVFLFGGVTSIEANSSQYPLLTQYCTLGPHAVGDITCTKEQEFASKVMGILMELDYKLRPNQEYTNDFLIQKRQLTFFALNKLSLIKSKYPDNFKVQLGIEIMIYFFREIRLLRIHDSLARLILETSITIPGYTEDGYSTISDLVRDSCKIEKEKLKKSPPTYYNIYLSHTRSEKQSRPGFEQSRDGLFVFGTPCNSVGDQIDPFMTLVDIYHLDFKTKKIYLQSQFDGSFEEIGQLR